jgi:alpha-glucosidase (family GH31 glycosyl hydrolase)
MLALFAFQFASAQQYPGYYTGHEIRGDTVRVNGETGSVQFQFYDSDILRVDFLPTPATIPDSSFTVVPAPPELFTVSVVDSPAFLSITSGTMTVRCDKFPIHCSYANGSGETILDHVYPGGLAASGSVRSASFRLPSALHLYGTGERGTTLDKRGLAFDSYNTAIGGYTTPLPTMNINIPFLATTGGFALFFDNTYRGRFDIGATFPTEFSYSASGGELTFYVIAAPSVEAQLERYTTLTGRQPLPPRWAFGYIQSKYGYQSRQEAENVIATMRSKRIPCDGLVIDLYWFRQMGDLSWNTTAFPDPFAMVDTFLHRGIKTILISEPYIVQYSPNFSEAASHGYLARTPEGESYLLPGWWSCGCTAALLDITNPEARAWWWSKYPGFLGTGVAGLWTDLAEPERHPLDMWHHLGTASKIHNIYNLLWAQTLFEGFASLRPDRRIFNLTRSGFAGMQRYGTIPWSGDVGKGFGGLAVQIPMMLNMGMSGMAYHNSDIGGFCCGNTTAELYVRWMQYGTFSPITRAHSVGQGPEPWTFGTEAETISRTFIELRYRLLPYIYTEAYNNYTTGLPLARPLFFSEPTDLQLTNNNDSYFWGSSILVSPVVSEGQTGKSVYLPEGKWVDFWSDVLYPGKTFAGIATPLNRIPIFVKAGAIVPMQQVMQYSDEKPLDTLILACYPEPGYDGAYSLYEDDGSTLRYQHGAYARTEFAQHMEIIPTGSAVSMELRFTISASRGAYEGKPVARTYRNEIHRIAHPPLEVSANGMTVPIRPSLAHFGDGDPGWYFDSTRHILHIQTPLHSDSSGLLLVSGVSTTTGIGLSLTGPAFVLNQNYPNPFNSSTMISFSLGERVPAELYVTDLLGRKVATIFQGTTGPGAQTLRFDASFLPAGVYFYTLRTPHATSVRKFLFLK